MKTAVIILTIFIFSGCSGWQNSSKEEACLVAQKLSDFKEIVQYFSVEKNTSYFPLPVTYTPLIGQSDPPLEIEGGKRSFVHVIIYRMIGGGYTLLLLDDSRPPKIVAARKLK